ncbi:3-oxoacyl-ACP synthase III family protein [Actinomyces ruminicola]|uniref:3-oxoacyl-[acyl-carrier-protein] synthase-3 n=1 Tax=Actinomyces ruminicola TaxID=332524 RepID=A0A1G9YV32_9ACTO|nr:ketoacyl-ACP synthase III [Actinomyces ruminicola]SDN12944.1 3-oxoacyl-[acyl-carrier-protein] synthase-3 [Actinomyces ruminicola]
MSSSLISLAAHDAGVGPKRMRGGLTMVYSPPGSDTSSVRVLGTGSFVPERVVSNDEVGGPAGVDDDWIRRKTGILSRRWADGATATSDLAVGAARLAIDDAGVDVSDISLLVVATSTPDHPQPATAAIVQGRLGAVNAAAYDLNSVCSGFEFALNTAARIVANDGGYCLVIGADIYSRILNPADRRSVILFGDGAGAVIIGRSKAGDCPEVLAGKMCTYGEYSDVIEVPMGGSRIPYGSAQDESLRYFRMNGRAVRSFVTEMLPGVVDAFLEDLGVSPDDVRHLIPHQANGVMLEEFARALSYRNMCQHLIVDQLANTGSASIPLTLDVLRREGVIPHGDLVLMAGFGGGMSTGLTLLRW